MPDASDENNFFLMSHLFCPIDPSCLIYFILSSSRSCPLLLCTSSKAHHFSQVLFLRQRNRDVPNWLFEAGGEFGWVLAGVVGTSREHPWCSVGWSRAVTRAWGTSALHWWGPDVVSAPAGSALNLCAEPGSGWCAGYTLSFWSKNYPPSPAYSISRPALQPLNQWKNKPKSRQARGQIFLRLF